MTRTSTSTVAIDLGGNRFAGEGQRREHLLAIMQGDAIALCAKALDGECDGACGHARLEAGSAAERQPSRVERNSNHDMKMRGQYRPISGLRHAVRHDMVRAMLTAEEIQILATSLGVAGRAVLFSLPVAIAFA